jgi:hypothetical protein
MSGPWGLQKTELVMSSSFDDASIILSRYIDEAIATKDRNLIRRIRRLWQYDAFGRGSRHGERWASILRKYHTEGSVWYVWWADGVNVFTRRNWNRQERSS